MENLIESCVSVELADCAEQPRLETETDVLEPNCDNIHEPNCDNVLEPNCDDIDPDMWASEFEVVDSRRADLSTMVSPPEMKGGSRNAKTNILYDIEWSPLRGYVAYRSRRALIKKGVM